MKGQNVIGLNSSVVVGLLDKYVYAHRARRTLRRNLTDLAIKFREQVRGLVSALRYQFMINYCPTKTSKAGSRWPYEENRLPSSEPFDALGSTISQNMNDKNNNVD